MILTQKLEPTRSAGLATLDTFLRKATEYASKRNFDVSGHPHVSLLSPYVSCRLISEHEVVSSVLQVHPYDKVEKFVQEVCWRTYWKGWLEMRPGVWEEYRSDLAGMDCDSNALRTATAGNTGIDCFDHWVHELTETGYLHNHARMWFASIWVFTLGLPWQLGADFFHRHLLDGDAASNTLSWRWVAGQQTPGKTYAARAENIRKFTMGRFDPEGQLNETPVPQCHIRKHPSPDATVFTSLPNEVPKDSNVRRGLLILGEDLSPETSPIASTPFVSIAGGWNADLQRTYGFAESVCAFRRTAMGDALERARHHWDLVPSAVHALEENAWVRSTLAWVVQEKLQQVVCLYPAVGPWREVLGSLRAALPSNTKLKEILRPWDREFWPHATKGFFPFREKISRLLARLGVCKT